MRKIEQKMNQAIRTGKNWAGANTNVYHFINDDGTRFTSIFLHCNHIANVRDGILTVNRYTLARWPSVTTKSRLRALGANVYTKRGVTYLDDVAV